LWPRGDGDLSEFNALADRHAYATFGTPHIALLGQAPLYQGRFQVVPDSGGRSFIDGAAVCGEKSVTGKLWSSGRCWRWSSLWHRFHGDDNGSWTMAH